MKKVILVTMIFGVLASANVWATEESTDLGQHDSLEQCPYANQDDRDASDDNADGSSEAEHSTQTAGV